MLDSGICTICKVVWDEKSVPKGRTLEPVFLPLVFEDRTVGVTRYYEAGRNGERIDRVIRIWRQSVSIRDVCVIGGMEYHIRQVQNTTDSDGQLTTDLALEEYPNGEDPG